MGAYNLLTAAASCPRCKNIVAVTVQFKYGNTWQFSYQLGDVLRWGGNAIGAAGLAHVVVDGIADTPCPQCGFDDEWRLYVHIRNDRLASVENASGDVDFAREARGYLVIRD